MSLTPVVLRNASDTYVAESAPATNYQGSTNLVVKAGAGTQFLSFLYFARPFPLGVTIVSATLRLYQVSASAISNTISLQRLNAPWTVSQTTWNQKPGGISTGQVQVTKGASPIGTEWAFDVTAHMQLVADGTLWRGWQLTTTGTSHFYFGSAQHAIYKPVLEITWSDQPQAPSTLSPSGNRAVSLAKPIVRFDFTDQAGNTLLQAVQVQINPTNTWGAPAFDSGTVLTSDAQLDLNTTAYAGLADGASTWWRVRVQDGAGLWSEWSLGAQFQRQTKGTLTLTNPPVSGLISEPTPPITWSLTGRTQSAYQVYVTKGAAYVYNSGKITGTATSKTLPDGILTDDTTYRVYVAVWDTISRESTPNDLPYVVVSRDFTYDYDVTVAAVTSLTGIDLAPAPGVTLTWSRSTAPDSFLVRRNGAIVASNLTPALISTGGTGYAYTDRGADPRKPVTWSVQAVVNGKTSANNPTVTKTLETEGIWLSDPDRGIAVQLHGADPGQWGMGEVAATYTAVGSKRGIRVTQALRGYEGAITGRLSPRPDRTLAQQEQDVYTLKSTPGQTYMLTLSNMTIPVVVGNISMAPLDRPDASKQVTFDFWAIEPPFDAEV